MSEPIRSPFLFINLGRNTTRNLATIGRFQVNMTEAGYDLESKRRTSVGLRKLICRRKSQSADLIRVIEWMCRMRVTSTAGRTVQDHRLLVMPMAAERGRRRLV